MPRMGDEKEPKPLGYYRQDPKTLSRKRRKLPENDEARAWRYKRIAYRCGLALLALPMALYFGPNLIMFGKLTRLAPADFSGEIQARYVPIVQAIKMYQSDYGQFPADLDALVPRCLTLRPNSPGQVINGRFVTYTQMNHEITYDFAPAKEGWAVGGPFANGSVALPKVTLPASTQPIVTPP